MKIESLSILLIMSLGTSVLSGCTSTPEDEAMGEVRFNTMVGNANVDEIAVEYFTQASKGIITREQARHYILRDVLLQKGNRKLSASEIAILEGLKKNLPPLKK